jgi:periplasmic divalent cation tolerance protein
MTHCMMITTIHDHDQAEKIARALLADQIVACVNVLGPCTSLYTWQGNVERETEYVLLMKTTAACEASVISRVQQLHPYEVPEVIVLPIHAGSSAYLSWITASVRPPENRETA